MSVCAKQIPGQLWGLYCKFLEKTGRERSSVVSGGS